MKKAPDKQDRYSQRLFAFRSAPTKSDNETTDEITDSVHSGQYAEAHPVISFIHSAAASESSSASAPARIASGSTHRNDNKLAIRRTLEFISQELGRELNTLSAKANDAEISQIVVQCKAELEKIREQFQNVE